MSHDSHCHQQSYIWRFEFGFFGRLEEIRKKVGASVLHGSYKQARDGVVSPALSCLGVMPWFPLSAFLSDLAGTSALERTESWQNPSVFLWFRPSASAGVPGMRTQDEEVFG